MDGPSRSPKHKPIPSGRSPVQGPVSGKGPPVRISTRSAKPEAPPARKPTSVKPLRIEPTQAATPQFLQPKPKPEPEAQRAPKRISSRAPKAEAAPEPELVPKRNSARVAVPKPAVEAEVKAVETPKAESKREPKVKSVRIGKAPSWANKKLAGILIALIVVLSGAAVTLAFKIHSKHQTVAHGEQSGSSDSGDAHESESGENIVHQANLPGTLKLPKRRAPTRANLLLARNGAVASGCTRPELLIDGDSINYDGNNGYAYSGNGNPNELMTVTLKEPAEMNRIRFLLWDRDDRHYSYILSVSADGKTFKPIQDNSKKECRSWQQIKFERQTVKAVAIKGFGDVNSGQLHVVEIEGYDDNESCTRLSDGGFESPSMSAKSFQ